MTMYTSSEREEAARRKLYDQVSELRGVVLDLLTLVRASNDPWPASTGMLRSRIDELRSEILQIERHDRIIGRARRLIDGTADSEKLTGPQS